MKAIISGGGTGGHIFPAIAIANAIKHRWPEAELLFIGAQGRMEMEKVPAAGYKIEALPIAGLQRSLKPKAMWQNLQLPFKVLRSQCKVKRIIRQFQPDVVVGVGGYASQPTLECASRMGLPTLLQEQNSYPGLTNKTLAKRARKICVAYEGLERFFPAEKIVLTGNPVREAIEKSTVSRQEGLQAFDLSPERRTILSVGGSLGARSINNMILAHLNLFRERDIQILWQTGRWQYDEAREAVEKAGVGEWVKVHQFIQRMDQAYAASDLVISRAGAIAISELCLVGKPCVLIPSPNVAEDHQTKNAMALVTKGAALMVRDEECKEKGLSVVLDLLGSHTKQEQMSAAIRRMGRPDAAERIAEEIAAIIPQPKKDPTNTPQT